MAVRKFYTKYDLPKYNVHYLDEHDKVDRLSYVDTPTQIKMFMAAGKNLKFGQNHALYNGLDSVMNDTTQFSTPVFSDDPVILAKRLEAVNSARNRVLGEISEQNVNAASEVKPNAVPTKDNSANPEAKPDSGSAVV